MKPKLNGIDHIHVYVNSWAEAEPWYKEMLGFERDAAFASWATKGGPLTLQNRDKNVHLALFERPDRSGASAIAFGASGEEFLAWKSYLEDKGLTLRVSDHTMAFSLYFDDPDHNVHEITTHEHEFVRQRLA